MSEVQYRSINALPLRVTALDANDEFLIYDGSTTKRMQWVNINNSITPGLVRTGATSSATLTIAHAGRMYVATGADNITLTLPTATVAMAGAITTFVNQTTNRVLTITAGGGTTFDGSTTNLLLQFPGDVATIIADPTTNRYTLLTRTHAATVPIYVQGSANAAVPITSRRGRVTTASYTTAAAGTVSFNLTYAGLVTANRATVNIITGGTNTRAILPIRTNPQSGQVELVFRNIDSNALNGTFQFDYFIE